MSFDVIIKMEVHTCENCGSVYGSPSWITYWRRACPMCAADKVSNYKNDVYELSNQVRGLKSALTRAKKERGR